MSGGNHKFHGRVLSPLNSGLMLLTARNKWICQTEPHILMAALQKPGIASSSLLCTESLPSPTLPYDHAQAHASVGVNLQSLPTSCSSKSLPTKNVQYALIVPETLLASHQHILASTAWISGREEVCGGASGTLVAALADVGLTTSEQNVQDSSSSPHIHSVKEHNLDNIVHTVALPTVHSITITSTDINGFDYQKFLSSPTSLSHTNNNISIRNNNQQLTQFEDPAVEHKHQSSQSPEQLQAQPHLTQHSTLPTSEGMNTGRPGALSGHTQSTSHSSNQEQQSHAMLSAGASAGPNSNIGPGIFRGSLAHADSTSRVMVSGSGNGQQYSNGGGGSGSSGSSLGQYPTLYNMHGQSPYSAFFPHYSASHYAPSSLVASVHYPHIESYSAVLASMGSHVQHGHTSPQSQTTGRPFLPGTLSQYAHRSLSTSSSPGPGSSSLAAHSPPGASASYSTHEHECTLVHGREQERDINSPHHVLTLSSSETHDDSSLLHSSNLIFKGSSGALLKESAKGDPRDPFYKVPSGKEGSLKHHILMRPPDVPVGSNSPETKPFLQSLKLNDMPRKTKHCEDTISSLVVATAPVSSSPPDPHVFTPPYALAPGPQIPRIRQPTNNSNTNSPSSLGASHLQHASSLSGQSQSGTNLPPHLHYPPHFMKGSIIQLANGDLKRVEDLQTDDFISSAQVSADLKVDSSTVVRIEEHPDLGTATLGFSVGEHRVQVTVEATLEHPFFVFGQGWSSCSTERTLQRYGLECHTLAVGDVCISLTHKDVPLKAAEIVSQQQQHAVGESITLASQASNAVDIEDSQKGDTESVKKGYILGQMQGNDRDNDPESGDSVVLFKPRKQDVDVQNIESQPFAQFSMARPTSLDTRPPRKRRWSAPEADVEKEKLEMENQTINEGRIQKI